MEDLLRSLWGVWDHQTQHIFGQLLRCLIQNSWNLWEVAPEVRPAVHTALLCLKVLFFRTRYCSPCPLRSQEGVSMSFGQKLGCLSLSLSFFLYAHVYIYIYAVELLSGPRLGVFNSYWLGHVCFFEKVVFKKHYKNRGFSRLFVQKKKGTQNV